MAPALFGTTSQLSISLPPPAPPAGCSASVAVDIWPRPAPATIAPSSLCFNESAKRWVVTGRLFLALLPAGPAPSTPWQLPAVRINGQPVAASRLAVDECTDVSEQFPDFAEAVLCDGETRHRLSLAPLMALIGSCFSL